MAAQVIDLREKTAASPAEVWLLLADSSTWPTWTPIERFELERPASADGLGEIRWFTTGRVRVREEIVECRPERRLSYTLLGGLALRDYRADIDLQPIAEGTEIHWHTTFRPKVPGTGLIYRRPLAKATQEFINGLAEHARRG